MSERILPTRFLGGMIAGTSQATQTRWQGYRLAIAGGVLLVSLAAVGYWTQHAVREYLHESLADDLEALIEAKAAALRLWARSEQDEARVWSESALVQAAVMELLTPAAQQSEVHAAAHELLHEALAPETRERESLGFVIADPAGRILAASARDAVGREQGPIGRALVHAARLQGTVLSRPVALSALLGSTSVDSQTSIVAAAAVGSVEQDGSAVLMFLLDPRADFSQILSVGHRGESRAYAFDSAGSVLSAHAPRDEEPRFVSAAQLPGADNALREPGGGLTRPVAAAIAGESGVDVFGYLDHHGTRVVGAWEWLPELDMGIVSEVPVRRAFGALRPLRLAFGGLFGLLALAGTIAFVVSYRVDRLQRHVRAIQRVGQYTLEEKIGEGGMGVVYRARHALLQRPTAVKLLKGSEATPEAVARFEQEVQLTSQLTHPHTVEIYDFGRTAEGVFYYAMELLPGLDLARLIELDGPQPPARVIHILQQACAALSEAHAAGLVHRDIKPLNIILCERGGFADFVKVLDFGLVKQIGPKDPQITTAEATAGTPMYIPPERLRDPTRSDVSTDIYALGCVAFNLLTGRHPFEGRTTMELCLKVLSSEAPRVATLAPAPIPQRLDALVAACLAKSPELRPSSVNALGRSLATLAEVLPWDQEVAQRWWRENEDRIRPRRADPETARNDGHPTLILQSAIGKERAQHAT